MFMIGQHIFHSPIQFFLKGVFSCFTVGYGADPAMGSLGVLGPTRMDYAGSISAVSAVARYVGRFIAESPK